MKLDVPFYLQTTPFDCGLTALRMILTYIDKDIDLEILKHQNNIKDNEAILTIQIAITAQLLGYKTTFFSKQINFNESNLSLDFYKKHPNILQKSKELIKKAEDIGVKLEEKHLSLKEILEKIKEDCGAIILLDWNIVNKVENKGYQGHFVPIVGYDEENIYVHNHGFNNPTKFLAIKIGIFEKARKAEGTDEDIVFIHKFKQPQIQKQMILKV